MGWNTTLSCEASIVADSPTAESRRPLRGSPSNGLAENWLRVSRRILFAGSLPLPRSRREATRRAARAPERARIDEVDGCPQCDVEHPRGAPDCPAQRLGRTLAGRYEV